MNNLPGLLGFAPGTLAIWAAMLFGVTCALAYLRSMRAGGAGNEDLLRKGKRGSGAAVGTAGGPALLPFEENLLSPNLLFARRLYYAYVFSILLASFLLLTRLISHDFRISYVASYSGRDLPFYYLFSTFWAGQEGSFLLWLFWGALIGLFVLRSAREQEAPVMVVYLATFLGIVAILVKQSPFRFLAQIPPDGQCLNPLLQDPWMVIQPPVMCSGFASLSVPRSSWAGTGPTRRSAGAATGAGIRSKIRRSCRGSRRLRSCTACSSRRCVPSTARSTSSSRSSPSAASSTAPS